MHVLTRRLSYLLIWAAALLVALYPTVGSYLKAAEDTPVQRHEMATNHPKRIVAEMSTRCLSDIRTLEDWRKQRPELRRQLLEMLGLSPLPARTPLKSN